MPVLLAFTVCGLLPGAALAQTDSPEYAGKYRNFGPFKKIAAALPEIRAAALKKIEHRLGLTADPRREIRIDLQDALPENADLIRRFDGLPFRTAWDGDRVKVTLCTEFLVNGCFDVETEVCHELTHAVMRTHMTPESYKKVPDWVREGLSVWTAEQMDAKVGERIRAHSKPVSEAELLLGLEKGPDTLERYAEYGLAIESIEAGKGIEAVRRFALEVINGATVASAIKDATGHSWADFEIAARAHARKRFEQLAPEPMNDYYQMMQADDRRDYASVISFADKLLKETGRSVLRPSILYHRGKACRMLGRRGEGEKSLKELLAGKARSCEWIDEGLYQLAKGRVEGEKYQEAIEPWRRLLRDHPDSENLDNVVYFLALCRSKTGANSEARRLLDVFDRSFPGSEYAEKAAALGKELARR